MIEYELDTEHAILHVQPKSAIEQDDFTKLAQAVDPYIEETGDLAGVIVEAPGFPGWESFGAMVNHFRFVREHHKHVKKVAVVTDSALGDVVPRLASHFVSAEIRHFPAGQAEEAQKWILDGG
ncbi:STAS/SEC14 domain-containing protein [Mycobacterium sp. MMS18-G62]